MLIVEIRARGMQRGEHIVVGRLEVDADGNCQFDGNQELTELTILDRGAPSGRILFEDDPVRWGRNIYKELRTPYIWAIVVEDTLPADDSNPEPPRERENAVWMTMAGAEDMFSEVAMICVFASSVLGVRTVDERSIVSELGEHDLPPTPENIARVAEEIVRQGLAVTAE